MTNVNDICSSTPVLMLRQTLLYSNYWILVSSLLSLSLPLFNGIIAYTSCLFWFCTLPETSLTRFFRPLLQCRVLLEPLTPARLTWLLFLVCHLQSLVICAMCASPMLLVSQGQELCLVYLSAPMPGTQMRPSYCAGMQEGRNECARQHSAEDEMALKADMH